MIFVIEKLVKNKWVIQDPLAKIQIIDWKLVHEICLPVHKNEETANEAIKEISNKNKSEKLRVSKYYSEHEIQEKLEGVKKEIIEMKEMITESIK